MRKIKIGQIGTLHDHAPGKIACVRQFPEIFEIVGYAAESDEQYEKVKDRNEFRDLKRMSEEELLNSDVDAMLIETYEYDLVKTAQKCVDRGIHVHVDKPAGANAEDFEKLLRDAKRKNVVVQMAYMYRYNPALKRAKEIIASGRVGEIYAVEAHMDCEHTDEKRQWLGNFEGGMMFFLGCHLVDLIFQLKGVPDEIIPYNMATGIDGVTSEDVGFALFRYKDGISFAKTSAAEPGGFTRRQFVICGSKGTLEINPIERFGENGGNMTCSMREVYKEDTAREGWKTCGVTKTYDFEPGDRYDAMMLDFAGFVRGEKENPHTYEYELQLQKMVLRACGVDIDYKEKSVL